MTPIAKYFGTPVDSSGNQLHWPGTSEGYPFRGPVPGMLKQEEYEEIPHVVDARAKMLYLPDDLKEYEEIIDKCANGWFVLRHEKFLEYDQEKKQLPVFIQWLEVYGHAPTPKNPYEAMANNYERRKVY